MELKQTLAKIYWSIYFYFFLLMKTLEFNLVEHPYFLEQGLPKFKRALWGDKPEGLLQKIVPIFLFFLFRPGPFGHL
jgi:hypothetical protein